MTTPIKQGDLVLAVKRPHGRWNDEVGTVVKVEHDDTNRGRAYYEVRWTNDPASTWEDREDLERVATSRLPRALRTTDDYQDDPAGTLKLWRDGFRPVEASRSTLRPGVRVAYVVTDPFMGNPVGRPRFATIRAVCLGDDDGYTLDVDHDGGTTVVDVGTTVWVERPTRSGHGVRIGSDDVRGGSW